MSGLCDLSVINVIASPAAFISILNPGQIGLRIPSFLLFLMFSALLRTQQVSRHVTHPRVVSAGFLVLSPTRSVTPQFISPTRKMAVGSYTLRKFS